MSGPKIEDPDQRVRLTITRSEDADVLEQGLSTSESESTIPADEVMPAGDQS